MRGTRAELATSLIQHIARVSGDMIQRHLRRMDSSSGVRIETPGPESQLKDFSVRFCSHLVCLDSSCRFTSAAAASAGSSE